MTCLVCLSEESKAVQDATDSMQELSVDTSSEVTPSNTAAETETSDPASTPAAGN